MSIFAYHQNFWSYFIFIIINILILIQCFVAGPSPAEVEAAILSAKEATNNVNLAQQQVQAAKQAVLEQQRLAAAKEAHARHAAEKRLG